MAEDNIKRHWQAVQGQPPRPGPTISQQWARERNWNKLRLRGAIATITNMSSDASMLPEETTNLLMALRSLESVLCDWDDYNARSKEYYKHRKEVAGK